MKHKILSILKTIPLGGLGVGLLLLVLLAACSTTGSLPEGSQLYIGQKPVK